MFRWVSNCTRQEGIPLWICPFCAYSQKHFQNKISSNELASQFKRSKFCIWLNVILRGDFQSPAVRKPKPPAGDDPTGGESLFSQICYLRRIVSKLHLRWFSAVSASDRFVHMRGYMLISCVVINDHSSLNVPKAPTASSTVISPFMTL